MNADNEQVFHELLQRLDGNLEVRPKTFRQTPHLEAFRQAALVYGKLLREGDRVLESTRFIKAFGVMPTASAAAKKMDLLIARAAKEAGINTDVHKETT